MKSSGILVFIIVATSLFSCKTQEIILHGEISGFVTDTITSQPLQAVAVKLNPINDTTSTSIEGKYLFKSLNPGDYKIETSKIPYATETKDVKVTSANPSETDFALHKIPYPRYSDKHLDFGFDSTLKSFTITNTGTGKLNYSLTASQDWITVSPNNSEVTTETDTIKVTINRTGLSEKKHIESIEVVSHIGQDLVSDTIYVLLNGVKDQDNNYYNIVTIGTQTWMAENLNVGKVIVVGQEQQDNGKIEKWCYDCKTYGGLYMWPEMMNYNPSDSGVIGTTQGICPTGWHIPTPSEWVTLSDYLGGDAGASGKMKEVGFTHWLSPNFEATNESGFTALPGGSTTRGTSWENDPWDTNPSDTKFCDVGNWGFFAESYSNIGYPPMCPVIVLMCQNNYISFGFAYYYEAVSVRCIKDPPKK